MKWEELKKLVISEYDKRNLASDVRYRSLDRIEAFIKTSPKAMNSIELLLQVDKKIIKDSYRDFRGVERLSSAESSCINEIYNHLNNLKLRNE